MTDDDTARAALRRALRALDEAHRGVADDSAARWDLISPTASLLDCCARWLAHLSTVVPEPEAQEHLTEAVYLLELALLQVEQLLD